MHKNSKQRISGHYMVKPVKEVELVARIKKLTTDNKNIEARKTIDTRKQNIH